jgi:hypothetical protein
MSFSAGRAVALGKAQTVTGYLVTALKISTDFVTREKTLFGWSWEPDSRGFGCTGPCRWNVSGSVRKDESWSELMEWDGAK